MGELSRTIGELGENITLENILKKIGWRGVPNIDIKCIFKDKHKRRLHGVDFFTAYKDPLALDTLINVIVSAKYNESTSIKSEFIEFAEELSRAAECIKFDQIYIEAANNHRLGKKKHPCVLFWLNHSSSDERNLLKKLSDINSSIKNKFESIYLVDNFRLNFLYKAIVFIENLYPNDSIEFVYPDTGVNEPIDGGREQAGKILPVEFINSPVLPFRIIQDNSQKTLAICLNEEFSKDSLKRMMGLAEGLTGGWCNKIVLAFPDYQASQHERIRDESFMSFTKNNFSDMVEVRSYNSSFKNLERTDIIEFSDTPDNTSANTSLSTMLPYGDRIRQLLVQSYIYKQDLQLLLSRRGVFVDKNTNKSDLIPLISKTLLSPSEFEYLRRRQIKKESAEKISDQKLPVSENFSNETILPLLQQALNSSLIDRIINENNYNCKMLGAPSFELDDNGDIRLNFRIQREDLTKDWTKASAEFDGQIVVKPSFSNSEGTFCRVDTISTSSETKQIAKQVIDYIIKQLKEQGLISTGAQSRKLLADSLVSRSNFLFSFISLREELSSEIKFKELLSIEFKLSSNVNQSVSEDVESLRNKVDKSTFSGHSLEEIKYVSDPKYRDFFDYYIMVCVFSVNTPYFKGDVHAEFGFPDLKTKPAGKSEFEFKILDLLPSDDSIILNSHNYHEVGLSVREELSRMKDYAYDLAEKTPQQTTIQF